MVSGLSILTNLLLVSAALAVQPHLTTSSWAGAVWSISDAPGTFTRVTGLFTVPTPKGNEGSSAAIWVGIDGASCDTALLQTGINIGISGGNPTYGAWYQWMPSDSQIFSGITISSGDNMNLTVIAFSPTSGQVVVENLSNGHSVTQYLTSSHALCKQDAEWIIEDYDVDGTPVTLTDFGGMTFGDAYASDAYGDPIFDPAGATLVDIEQDGQLLTYTYAIGSSVTIEYIGPVDV